MPIANISTLYQRIRNGSEGGNEFARFMNLLLTAESKDRHLTYVSFDDATGDFKGVDAIQYENNEFSEKVNAFQFKFYKKNLSIHQRQEIKKSLGKARKKFEFMEQWVIVTPEDWEKDDMEWFEKLKKENEFDGSIEVNDLYRPFRFRINHWGHNHIIELSLKHPHIGRHYFPELYKDSGGLIKLANFLMDVTNTNWRKSEHSELQYYQTDEIQNKNITSDPVFDIQILNNTENIFLVQSIDIKIEKVWSTLKGIPTEFCLKSVGIVTIQVDFDKEITTKVLQNPIIINSKSAFRFSLQLKNFVKKAPGNWVTFCVIFRLNNNKELLSKSITLGF